MEEVAQYFPDFKALDATEQEIPRPGNKRRRKSDYSGKKKRHTVKTQLAVNSKGLIVHRTNHARGRRHDYDVYKQRHPDLPEQVESEFDSSLSPAIATFIMGDKTKLNATGHMPLFYSTRLRFV